MDHKEFEKSSMGLVNTVINRLAINHVVCHYPSGPIGDTFLTLEQCNEHLTDPQHRLAIHDIFMFNNKNIARIISGYHEHNDIKKVLANCTALLNKTVADFCEFGENIYSASSVFRTLLASVDESIISMNYQAWLQKIFSENKKTFYVLLNKKLVLFENIQVDIYTFCRHIIAAEFDFRLRMLYDLKACFVDLYSKYLVLPKPGSFPKFDYTCSKTDLSEIIFSLYLSGHIKEFARFEAILLEMLGISSEEHTSARHEIRKRKKAKSVTTKELSDLIENLTPPKKRVKKTIQK